MTTEMLQPGPERENRPVPASVFDVLKDEIRQARGGETDLQGHSDTFNFHLKGLHAIYGKYNLETNGPQARHRLLSNIVSGLEAMAIVSAGAGNKEGEAAAEASFNGALLATHAHTSMLPGKERLELLTEPAAMNAEFDESADEDQKQAELEQQLQQSLRFTDETYQTLPEEDRRTLDFAALLACRGTEAQRTSFIRGFLFADARIKEVRGKLKLNEN